MPDEETLYIDPTLPVREAFNNLPAGFKSFLKRGFSTVAFLSKKGLTVELITMILEEDTGGTALSPTASKEIAERLWLKPGDVPQVTATVTFCLSMFAQQEGLSPAEFVSAGLEDGFLVQSDQEQIKQFLQVVADSRSSAAEMTERKRLASRMLPMLSRFSMMIDIRPAFSDDDSTVKLSVPVVIAQISNDTNDDDLWFQMSKRQVERLIVDFKEVLRKIEVAERWSAGNTTA